MTLLYYLRRMRTTRTAMSTRRSSKQVWSSNCQRRSKFQLCCRHDLESLCTFRGDSESKYFAII
ncbi:hypothetical protein V1477_013623 [Vespula maculifrons]|uniref:Uncharacterized protein n=1 Tax=Vespula maculifrons TaxID=7453 RepID=A0ABD2BQQ1_VESMC